LEQKSKSIGQFAADVRALDIKLIFASCDQMSLCPSKPDTQHANKKIEETEK